MKVLNPGERVERVWRAECPQCGCHVQCDDLHDPAILPAVGFPAVDCPTPKCERQLRLYPCDPRAPLGRSVL